MDCSPKAWAPKELSILTSVISGVIGFIAIIGNGLIVVAVIKDPLKKLHTTFSYFLVNLAVADLIVGSITMPISVYLHYLESKGPRLLPSVKVLHISYFISGTASILSLIALSVDRFIAINWALQYRQFTNWKRYQKVTAVIWFLSLSIPFLYLELGYINYLLFYANSAILTSFVVMLIVYYRIYAYLRRHMLEMKAKLSSNSSAGERFHLNRLYAEKKITRTFLAILFVFIFTYISAVVMAYILHFCKSCNCTLRHILRDAQFILISTNSCVNPFIYTTRLTHFRKSIRILLTKKRVASTQSTPDTPNAGSNENVPENNEESVYYIS